LAELHEKTDVVSEREVRIATCDCRLQRLLHCLLRMEPNWGIRHPLLSVQCLGRRKILTCKRKKVGGQIRRELIRREPDPAKGPCGRPRLSPHANDRRTRG
jgi:hypothetical protein